MEMFLRSGLEISQSTAIDPGPAFQIVRSICERFGTLQRFWMIPAAATVISGDASPAIAASAAVQEQLMVDIFWALFLVEERSQSDGDSSVIQ
jgi:hypothetical protein